MLGGLGGLINIGMMAYGLYNTHKTMQNQKQSMSDINAEINGGKESELGSEIKGNDKLGKEGENYLKLSGNRPPKTSGLGFKTNQDGGSTW